MAVSVFPFVSGQLAVLIFGSLKGKRTLIFLKGKGTFVKNLTPVL
jgi:hypothetical protein